MICFNDDEIMIPKFLPCGHKVVCNRCIEILKKREVRLQIIVPNRIKIYRVGSSVQNVTKQCCITTCFHIYRMTVNGLVWWVSVLLSSREAIVRDALRTIPRTFSLRIFISNPPLAKNFVFLNYCYNYDFAFATYPLYIFFSSDESTL